MIRNNLSLMNRALIGLMAMLVAGGAWAEIDLDEDDQAVTFASETLTTEVEDHPGYYVVNGDGDVLNISADLGFSTPNSANLFVRYDLTNMVFNSAIKLTVSGGGGAGVLRQGGMPGDNFAVFYVPGGTGGTRLATADVTLDVTSFGVSARNPGSVSMNVKDDLGIPAETTTSGSGVVKVSKGLMPGEMSMNINPVTLVSTKFLSFQGRSGVKGVVEPEATTQVVSVGSVYVEIVGGVVSAENGKSIDVLKDLIVVEATVANTAAKPEPTAGQSTVVFSGDFSFATSVWLDEAPACNAKSPVNLKMTGDDADMTRLRTQTLGYLNANRHLCIMVAVADSADAVPIPETSPYLATKTFVAAVENAALPPGMVEHPLGRIMRDGTTIQLPYLTQFDAYNQRIVIRNRGAEADYSFTFDAEEGVTVTPGAEAEGTLPANSTTYLSLLHGDLVTISGARNRTSATLVIESEKHYIDVLISQTNAGGTTDTVTYTQTDR